MVINVQKHITYWRASADEDWAVGNDLVKRGRIRHGLFFIHLALEKILNAYVCKKTDDFAPRIHSLIRLAGKSGLNLTEIQLDFLAGFDRFDIAGRYPDSMSSIPNQTETKAKVTRAGELYRWLRQQL